MKSIKTYLYLEKLYVLLYIVEKACIKQFLDLHKEVCGAAIWNKSGFLMLAYCLLIYAMGDRFIYERDSSEPNTIYIRKKGLVCFVFSHIWHIVFSAAVVFWLIFMETVSVINILVLILKSGAFLWAILILKQMPEKE